MEAKSKDQKCQAVEEDIVKKIKENKVVAFTVSTCEYCQSLKRLLQKHEVKFTAYDLDKMDNGEIYKGVLKEMVGTQTVPKVFINGQFVGGFDDVNKAIQEGSFNRLLEETASFGEKKEGTPQMHELCRLVKEHPVCIIANSQCPNCNAVKDQLRSTKSEYQHVEIDKKPNPEKYEQALQQMTGKKDVPALFVNGTYKGGLDEIRKCIREGKFAERPQTEVRKEGIDVQPRA